MGMSHCPSYVVVISVVSLTLFFFIRLRGHFVPLRFPEILTCASQSILTSVARIFQTPLQTTNTCKLVYVIDYNSTDF